MAATDFQNIQNAVYVCPIKAPNYYKFNSLLTNLIHVFYILQKFNRHFLKIEQLNALLMNHNRDLPTIMVHCIITIANNQASFFVLLRRVFFRGLVRRPSTG